MSKDKSQLLIRNHGGNLEAFFSRKLGIRMKQLPAVKLEKKSGLALFHAGWNRLAYGCFRMASTWDPYRLFGESAGETIHAAGD